MESMEIIPEVTLEGDLVRLEPLAVEHREGLCDAIRQGELWNLHYTLVPHPDEMDAFLERAENLSRSGDSLVFAIIEKASEKVAGTTRFLHAKLRAKRIEIGYSFLGIPWQKTRINTESKYLMLQHAFETMQLNRVEFVTDYFNTQSRRAILGLGAKEEGILRNHMVMPNGRIRDSVLYSIIESEWRGVKEHLQWKLARRC